MVAHLRRNLIAYLALFVALSGTAVAATKLPRNSVGAKQIKKGAITGKKVKKNTLGGAQINEAKLGVVPSAATAATAATAAKATDADTVGGQPATAFLKAGDKAVDADKLDGVDSTVFGDTITVLGYNFEPRDNVGTRKKWFGTGAISCDGSAADFLYRVDLPQGASVTGLDFRYKDDSSTFSTSLQLYAYDPFELTGSLSKVLATASEPRDDGDRHTVKGELASDIKPIDNSKYSYELIWSPGGCDPEVNLVGAAVHYTLPR